MKIKAGLSAFILTGAVLLASFYAGGLFPFGYETVSWCDMNQQVIPLFCDFKDIVSGGESIFINFKNAGGMNFYGVFFFFLASPFSFLAAFVPKMYIPFLMNVLVVLKLCCSAFTGGVFFEKTCRKLGWELSAFLGACYALCGYGMMFYQNIMWLDIMCIFPVIMLGLYKLTNRGNSWLLTISLAVCVVLNYYISFMVYLFVIIFMGIYAIFHKDMPRRLFFDLGVSGLLSLALSAVVWLPSFLQYTASGRGAGIIAQLKNSSFFAPYETTLPVLLCGGVIFAALLVVLPRLAVSGDRTMFLFCVFLAVFIPVIIEPANLMWHTGSYMSFPVRYGFITVFAGLLLAAGELSSVPYAPVSRTRGVLTGTAAAVTAGAFMIALAVENRETLSNYVRTLWGNKSSFEGLIVLCLFSVLAYGVIFFLSRKGMLSRRMAAGMLCLVVAAEGFCGVSTYMLSARGKFDLQNYQSFISLADGADTDYFYRVNTNGKLIDANMTGAAGFNSIGHYTSLNDETFMKAAKRLGYSGYWMETGNWGGSVISDALLSIRYTAVREKDGYSLRENPGFLGLGISVKGELPRELSDHDRLSCAGEVFGEISGGENPVVRYEPYRCSDCVYYETDDTHFIETPATGPGGIIEYNIDVKERQTLYFDCYNGFSNNLIEPVNDSFAVYVNGAQAAASYPSQSNNGLLELGSFENEQVDIILTVLKDAECSSFGVFGVREETFAGEAESVDTLDLNLQNGKICGQAAKAGKYFISLPYKDGYTVRLNGEKIGIDRVLTGFISVDIKETGFLEISFVPKGFTVGCVISIVGLSASVLFLIFRRRKRNLSANISNAAYGMFLGVFVIIVLSVYIIPIVINLSSLRL